jgi:sugar O-acyltransferase (sialic acid O-acetyltransferase NeuD family)
MNGMEEIVIIGGGGHSKVVISIVKKLARYRILGYTDLKDNGAVLGIPFIGGDRELGSLATGRKKLSAVIAVGQVGQGKLRCELYTRLLTLNLCYPPIISPDAIVSNEAFCGEGAVVMDGAVICAGARMGGGSIVNTNSTIEHDSIVSDWVHVGPGATICGGVTIGQFSMIGAGATVIEGVEIAAGCIVGAGATVVHNLAEAGVYVGCPVRRIR